MVRAENKYEARLLDKENTWGKPSEEQEKIMAMTAEINSLKKECRGTAVKTNKLKPTGKKQATKKALPKKMTDQKKRAVDKWAWKSKPPKESNSKEDNAFIKTFKNKKYYWCITHNNGTGMWTLHHPKDCEIDKATPCSAANTNIATFDTLESNSDQERQLRQSQVLTWFWLAITRNFLWLLLPDNVGMSIAAFFLMSGLIFILILDCIDAGEPHPYVPKTRQPHKSLGIKTLCKAMNWCTSIMTNVINNMKVRHKYQPPGHCYFGHRYRCKKYRCGLHTALTSMTTTWANEWSKSPSLGRQFDSDLQALMLGDCASACITNDKDDFIEPPKRVDYKVNSIKGHAKATHRGTIKWHVKDDNGLVNVMVIKGAYLIPDAATRILSPQHLAQQAEDHYLKEEGTGALTTGKNITLFWSQRHFAKTVPLDPSTNVGLTTTASGARSFCAFCATITVPETIQPNIFTTHIIPNEDDNDTFQPKDPVKPPSPEENNHGKMLPKTNDSLATGPQTALIDLGPITHMIPEDQEPMSLDPHDELLRWHYRLGHLPFDHIKQLALKGQLPKGILASKKPFCSACQYGK